MANQTQRENARRGELPYTSPDFITGKEVRVSAGVYGPRGLASYTARVVNMKFNKKSGVESLSSITLQKDENQSKEELRFDPGTYKIEAI